MAVAAAIAEEPAPLPVHQRARGKAVITTKLRDGATHIDRLYQDGCAKLRLPRTHARHMEAVLINTAGGLTGGDELAWSAEAAPGTHLVLTTQACERVYRSLGPDAKVGTTLNAGAGARIDWLPQETIMFEGSRLSRTLTVELAGDASLLAVEAILLGRDAMGETARSARLLDRWRISRDGRLLHADATQLTGEAHEREAISLLGDGRALATLVYIGPDAERRQQRIAGLVPGAAQIGHSRIGERLVVRALAHSGLALRRLIVPILVELSGAGGLPRVWHL